MTSHVRSALQTLSCFEGYTLYYVSEHLDKSTDEHDKNENLKLIAQNFLKVIYAFCKKDNYKWS